MSYDPDEGQEPEGQWDEELAAIEEERDEDQPDPDTWDYCFDCGETIPSCKCKKEVKRA